MPEEVLTRRDGLIRGARGNWDAFPYSIDQVKQMTASWRDALRGVEKPWLCWNVSERWCRLQQRLVLGAGWTPVIGSDPRTPPPPVEPGAIPVDFNAGFKFPVLHPVVPLEFVWLYAPRLAFWHSDLLCREETVAYLARTFESLKDGEVAAVPDRRGLRYIFQPNKHRYWELACCVTAGASRDQFEKGSGWWRHIHMHPNCPEDEREKARRRKVFYAHGGGVMYWKRRYGGRVVELDARRVEEGHCTSINNPNYKHEPGQRNLPVSLDANYDIEEVARRLGIAHLL